ncbi:hypothetical protein AB1L30_02250 [Bremerella sp. JC817]|uniref:hypothetical protein n=1 Tax=Bremerella sp. JC817 TaxID=3231756 RepID=UPI00345AD5D4
MNHDIESKPDRDLLELATQAMKDAPVSSVPIGVLEKIENNRSELPFPASQQHEEQRIFRFILAASVLVLLGFFVWRSMEAPKVALADVLKKIVATKTFQAKVDFDEAQGLLTSVEGKQRFISTDGRSELFGEVGSAKAVQLDHANKIAYVLSASNTLVSTDIVSLIQKLADSGTEPIEDYVTLTGKHFSGLSGKFLWGMKPDDQVPAKVQVWSDAETELPVRLKVVLETNPESIFVFDEIKFDTSIDASTVVAKIPEGYQRLGDQQLAPPISSDAAEEMDLVLKPGIGIGKIQFGATRAEIVAEFGEPEFTLLNDYLCYPSLGMQLVLTGREPDKLGMIIANPADAANLQKNPFPGRTEEGIRIDSTREQVIAAYGEPDAPQKNSPQHPVLQDLGYAAKRIRFILLEDKVAQIILARP